MTDKYLWRQLSVKQREELLAWRKARRFPWHSPPHCPEPGDKRFHITTACVDHQPFIGYKPDRLEAFSEDLLATLASQRCTIFAWCVLPNHYHTLVETVNVRGLLAELGRLHGRTSYVWNGEENERGRSVFFRATDRAMRSEGHFWSTVNYINNNPVHHGYVGSSTDWPWSSVREYLQHVGKEEAERIWREFPIRDYGRGWDDPDM